MKLAAKIEEGEVKLVQLKDALTTATEALEAAPDEETLLAEVEELTLQVEKSTATLAALKKAEKALASRVSNGNVNDNSGGNGAPAIIPDMSKHKSLQKGGELIWKHATATFIAHVEKKPVSQVLEERYGDDTRVKETFDFIKKSAVNPAMTTNAAWAGALVREDTRGFIASLEDVSVAAQLNRYSPSLSFDGYGSIKMPIENDIAAQPSEPAWVGEGGVIPLTSFSFGSKTMNPYKLAAITTMTEELAQRSTPAIEALVQRGLRKAYARVLDHALLDPAIAAVANVRPASLTNGVTPIAAAAGQADENVRADILALLTAMTTARLGARPVLIANNVNVLTVRMMVNAMGEFLFRDELGSGNLLSIPVISSGHVPLNRLIMVDAEYVATAFGSIDFDISNVATVTQANADLTAPTQANYGASGAVGAEAGRVDVDGGIMVGADASQGAGAAGYTARSLWQTYSLGIRMIAQTSFMKTQDKAVQMISAVKWS